MASDSRIPEDQASSIANRHGAFVHLRRNLHTNYRGRGARGVKIGNRSPPVGIRNLLRAKRRFRDSARFFFIAYYSRTRLMVCGHKTPSWKTRLGRGEPGYLFALSQFSMAGSSRLICPRGREVRPNGARVTKS